MFQRVRRSARSPLTLTKCTAAASSLVKICGKAFSAPGTQLAPVHLHLDVQARPAAHLIVLHMRKRRCKVKEIHSCSGNQSFRAGAATAVRQAQASWLPIKLPSTGFQCLYTPPLASALSPFRISIRRSFSLSRWISPSRPLFIAIAHHRMA